MYLILVCNLHPTVIKGISDTFVVVPRWTAVVRRRCPRPLFLANNTKQVTLVKDNIMPRLIILSGVDDEGVRVDVSRAYASISSNAQCQASLN